MSDVKPAMTAAEMVERDRYLREQHDATCARLAELGARIKALEKDRQLLIKRTAEITAERKELAREYAKGTGGMELRKASRMPTFAAVEQAHGALLSAMCEPAHLPLTNPVVVARLAAYRDALDAHAAYKASRPAVAIDADEPDSEAV